MTLLYILLGGVVSVLAARAPLPPGIGLYWRCYSFSARPVVAVVALIEFVSWSFIAGLAAAGATSGVGQAAGIDAETALAVIAAAAGAGAGLITHRRRRRKIEAGDSFGALAERAVQTLDGCARRGIPKKLGKLSAPGLAALATDLIAEVRDNDDVKVTQQKRKAMMVALAEAHDALVANATPDTRQRAIDACAVPIRKFTAGYTRREWRAFGSAN